MKLIVSCVLSVVLPSAVGLRAQAPSLESTAWTLTALPGTASISGSPTMRFEGGRVSGLDGCNTYRASYTADATSFAVTGPIVTTRKACGGAADAQARALQTALSAARAVRVSGDRLVLVDGAGAELATFAAQPQDVTGTTWTITGYNNGKKSVVSLLDGTTLTLSFGANGSATGSAGCNRFSGSYTTNGQKVSIGPLAATRKMCTRPEAIMEQEAAYLKALMMGQRVRIDGDRLEIRTDDDALAISARRAKP